MNGTNYVKLEGYVRNKKEDDGNLYITINEDDSPLLSIKVSLPEEHREKTHAILKWGDRVRVRGYLGVSVLQRLNTAVGVPYIKAVHLRRLNGKGN